MPLCFSKSFHGSDSPVDCTKRNLREDFLVKFNLPPKLKNPERIEPSRSKKEKKSCVIN